MHYLGTLFLKVVLCSTIPQCPSLTPLKEFSSPAHAGLSRIDKIFCNMDGSFLLYKYSYKYKYRFLNVLLLSKC